MKVHLITIGDEILIGQVIDTNSAWMAQQLNLIGAQVMGISSVSDTADAIRHGLEEVLPKAEVILMTGGLGPTRDDITKKTLADFFGAELYFDQPTYDRILKLFERWQRSPTEAHRQQSYMPANATLLYNKMGTAPGMWFEYDGKVIVSMPGVPYEMKYLMEAEVIPKLRSHFPGRPIAHRTLMTVGEGESRIADRIAVIEDQLPPNIKLAYLPNLGQVRLRLSGSGDDENILREELEFAVRSIADQIPELIFGYDNEKLEAAIGRLLKQTGLRIGTAESCTGGYLAHLLTSISGSSDYFQGSIVAYANEIKVNLLGVSPETLEVHGAVSEATVREMVQGTLKALDVDIAVAISGIAGPSGGTPEKPVGTIWIAVGNGQHTEAIKIHAGKDRQKNIHYAAVQALNSIRLFVTNHHQVVKFG